MSTTYVTCLWTARKKGRFSTKLKSKRLVPLVKLNAPTKERSYAKSARSTKSTAWAYSKYLWRCVLIIDHRHRHIPSRCLYTSDSWSRVSACQESFPIISQRPWGSVICKFLDSDGKMLRLPPDCTMCINDFVTPLYLLLYSTVHHFSSNGSHPCAEHFRSTSSLVRGRIDRPSRPLAVAQFGCGRVRFDLRATPCRLAADPEGPELEDLFACTTFDPKNFRISPSLSRYCNETDNRSAMVLPLGVACAIFCVAGYLKLVKIYCKGDEEAYCTDSSARALSNSSSAAFFSFARAFFKAFFSFLTGGAGVLRDGFAEMGVSGRGTSVPAGFFFFFFPFFPLAAVPTSFSSSVSSFSSAARNFVDYHFIYESRLDINRAHSWKWRCSMKYLHIFFRLSPKDFKLF